MPRGCYGAGLFLLSHKSLSSLHHKSSVKILTKCILTMLDGTHTCMPMDEPGDNPNNQFRYSNRGNGYGSLFGGSSEERECTMAHYRSWLNSQGEVCDEAIALQVGAVGAGAVALGSCRQFSRAPNLASGLGFGGSYLVLLSAAWLGNRRVNDCTANYPGPGAAC